MVNAVQAMQHLAALAAVERRPQTAARLLGYVDAALARLASIREYGDGYTRDRALEALNEALPGSTIQRLLSEGAALSDDEAFALAVPVKAPGPDAPQRM
jgi:hypothetical protein